MLNKKELCLQKGRTPKNVIALRREQLNWTLVSDSTRLDSTYKLGSDVGDAISVYRRQKFPMLEFPCQPFPLLYFVCGQMISPLASKC